MPSAKFQINGQSGEIFYDNLDKPNTWFAKVKYDGQPISPISMNGETNLKKICEVLNLDYTKVAHLDNGPNVGSLKWTEIQQVLNIILNPQGLGVIKNY